MKRCILQLEVPNFAGGWLLLIFELVVLMLTGGGGIKYFMVASVTGPVRN